MIYLNRAQIRLPRDLRIKAINATDRLVQHAIFRDRQTRIQFVPPIWQEFAPLLVELTLGKCAYCESVLSSENTSSVNHFRPISSVAEDPKHDGYYWLAYDWNNLLPACAACANNKRDRFPLLEENHRARSKHDNIAAEYPLLLNPCEHTDFLVRHFVADAEGRFVPLSKRGAGTIDILGLNRPALVGARCKLAEQITEEYERIKFGAVEPKNIPTERFSRLLRKRLTPDMPYLGFGRMVISRLVYGKLTPREQRLVDASLSEPTGTDSPVRQPSGYIERVEIRNFKCIPKLDLTFDFARKNYVGWQVFLGENGTGKSSILQALALALGGRANLQSVGVHGRDLTNRDGSARGRVRLWMSSQPEPITLTFSSTGVRFPRGHHDGANFFVRAYGATRLLPREGQTKPRTVPGERRVIQNLFNPHYPLCDVSVWLRKLSTDDFDKVALTLKDILKINQTDNIVLVRQGNEVFAKPPVGPIVQLHLLSQGQQAALVLAVDIMAGIMKDREAMGIPSAPGDFRQSAGIVLLDEIDAHLHPRWKMDIVRSLRTAFPQLQFIVTTHEPLCLRGLEEREIVIMRHTKGKLEATITEISPKGWRVDQLLTSPLFGLNSTIDPEVEADFRRYYELLAKPDANCTAAERTERANLSVKVQVQNRLGFTRRDQLLYEVIDKCLAEEGEYGLAKQATLHEQTKQKVADLWRRITRLT